MAHPVDDSSLVSKGQNVPMQQPAKGLWMRDTKKLSAQNVFAKDAAGQVAKHVASIAKKSVCVPQEVPKPLRQLLATHGSFEDVLKKLETEHIDILVDTYIEALQKEFPKGFDSVSLAAPETRKIFMKWVGWIQLAHPKKWGVIVNKIQDSENLPVNALTGFVNALQEIKSQKVDDEKRLMDSMLAGAHFAKLIMPGQNTLTAASPTLQIDTSGPNIQEWVDLMQKTHKENWVSTMWSAVDANPDLQNQFLDVVHKMSPDKLGKPYAAALCPRLSRILSQAPAEQQERLISEELHFVMQWIAGSSIKERMPLQERLSLLKKVVEEVKNFASTAEQKLNEMLLRSAEKLQDLFCIAEGKDLGSVPQTDVEGTFLKKFHEMMMPLKPPLDLKFLQVHSQQYVQAWEVLLSQPKDIRTIEDFFNVFKKYTVDALVDEKNPLHDVATKLSFKVQWARLLGTLPAGSKDVPKSLRLCAENFGPSLSETEERTLFAALHAQIAKLSTDAEKEKYLVAFFADVIPSSTSFVRTFFYNVLEKFNPDIQAAVKNVIEVTQLPTILAIAISMFQRFSQTKNDRTAVLQLLKRVFVLQPQGFSKEVMDSCIKLVGLMVEKGASTDDGRAKIFEEIFATLSPLVTRNTEQFSIGVIDIVAKTCSQAVVSKWLLSEAEKVKKDIVNRTNLPRSPLYFSDCVVSAGNYVTPVEEKLRAILQPAVEPIVEAKKTEILVRSSLRDEHGKAELSKKYVGEDREQIARWLQSFESHETVDMAGRCYSMKLGDKMVSIQEREKAVVAGKNFLLLVGECRRALPSISQADAEKYVTKILQKVSGSLQVPYCFTQLCNMCGGVLRDVTGQGLPQGYLERSFSFLQNPSRVVVTLVKTYELLTVPPEGEPKKQKFLVTSHIEIPFKNYDSQQWSEKVTMEQI
jgi:hypothetical protein